MESWRFGKKIPVHSIDGNNTYSNSSTARNDVQFFILLVPSGAPRSFLVRCYGVLEARSDARDRWHTAKRHFAKALKHPGLMLA